MLDVELGKDLSLSILNETHSHELLNLIIKNQERLEPWFSWANELDSEKELKLLISQSKKNPEQKNIFDSGIWSEGKLIGIIGFSKMDLTNSKGSISYWIDKKYQGRGISSKAIELYMNYCFKELKLNKIEILCPEGNHRALQIPIKLGFEEEGRLRQETRVNGRFLDMVLFSMLAREWI